MSRTTKAQNIRESYRTKAAREVERLMKREVKNAKIGEQMAKRAAAKERRAANEQKRRESFVRRTNKEIEAWIS